MYREENDPEIQTAEKNAGSTGWGGQGTVLSSPALSFMYASHSHSPSLRHRFLCWTGPNGLPGAFQFCVLTSTRTHMHTSQHGDKPCSLTLAKDQMQVCLTDVTVILLENTHTHACTRANQVLVITARIFFIAFSIFLSFYFFSPSFLVKPSAAISKKPLKCTKNLYCEPDL